MSRVVSVLPQGQSLGSGLRAGRVVAARGPKAEPLGGAEVIARLEEAGATLLAMPSHGYTTHLRQMRFDIVHAALDAYGWEAPALRAPVPSAGAITAMDEAFSWLTLIPDQSYLLRRIVSARALVHPLTGRHLFAWRRLATMLGADHKSVQRWHANGITMLCRGLNE